MQVTCDTFATLKGMKGEFTNVNGSNIFFPPYTQPDGQDNSPLTLNRALKLFRGEVSDYYNYYKNV